MAGKRYEKQIEPTIEELKHINPQLIIPSHCTGWQALYTIAKAFPDGFVWNGIESLYQLLT